MSKHTTYIIALSKIKGVGAAFIKRNYSLIKSYADNLEMLSSIGGKVTLQAINQNISKAEAIIDFCTEKSIKITSIIDNDYPPSLLEIKDPPPVIYSLGNYKKIEAPIAIIGTRKSTDLGNKIANRIGLYFSKEWSICNGLVNGIDKNSILINNQILPNVVGVLSGGLNFEITSSKITKELAKQVLEKGGLLVSENEPNKKEDQFSGSKASRIQAGLSKALVLVQSSTKGGSKYTIKTYSSLNRPIGIIEFKNNQEFIQGDSFSGNRLLLKKGKEGIAEMCNINKNQLIKTSCIIPIREKGDYKQLEEAIKK